MHEKTGKIFNRKQLKNKWEIMKKDWKLYDRLMRLESGIGGTRKLDMSPEWWEEKIKMDKEFAMFRDANLTIYESHYAPLFRDAVAVGDHVVSPLEFQNTTTPIDVDVEGQGDSDEVNVGDDKKSNELFTTLPTTSSGKRKKSKDVANKRSTKSKSTDFEEKLDVVLDAISSIGTPTFPQNTALVTISDCLNIVTTFPDFEEGSLKFSRALLTFVKKQNREAFMYPTSRSKDGLS